MKYEEDSRVPEITGATDPYMSSLYERLGMGVGDDPQIILNGAETAWNAASDIGGRVEAIEALMGRRIDGSEIGTLPIELTDAIFNGEPFRVAVQAVAETLQKVES